jgi:hypothetical protein
MGYKPGKSGKPSDCIELHSMLAYPHQVKSEDTDKRLSEPKTVIDVIEVIAEKNARYLSQQSE